MDMQYPLITRDQLDALEIGDRVIRLLAGVIPIKGLITKVEPELIRFAELGDTVEKSKLARNTAKRLGLPDLPPEWDDIMPEWTFNPETGLEIDEDLGRKGLFEEDSISYLSLDK